MVELQLLYTQKTVVGGFANDYYWSSVKNNVGNMSPLKSLGDGSEGWNHKHYTHLVRAVRAF
jgi:hypothetical protein